MCRFNIKYLVGLKCSKNVNHVIDCIFLAVILPSNQLLLFGGTGIPFGDAASNQIYACDLRKLSWKHVQCTGTPPTRGYGHVGFQLEFTWLTCISPRGIMADSAV